MNGRAVRWCKCVSGHVECVLRCAVVRRAFEDETEYRRYMYATFLSLKNRTQETHTKLSGTINRCGRWGGWWGGGTRSGVEGKKTEGEWGGGRLAGR